MPLVLVFQDSLDTGEAYSTLPFLASVLVRIEQESLGLMALCAIYQVLPNTWVVFSTVQFLGARVMVWIFSCFVDSTFASDFQLMI